MRRNEFDVTNRVNTTLPDEVADEVLRIYRDLYQCDQSNNLPQMFEDASAMYRGDYPGFRECDTAYHDIQHVLDVTLAMARLMDGCVKASSKSVVDERLFRFGICTALFHDVGYLRRRGDTRHENGAEYTKIHVSRGSRFLRDYMEKIGMPDLADAAARTIHFTGYEVPVERIHVEPQFRLIGNLLGSADIMAQMADRCYLEKCFERLYTEFVRGGIARKQTPDGKELVIFSSATDLIYKTPGFYAGAQKRLHMDLRSHCDYVAGHFSGENPYVDETEKNIRYAQQIATERDPSLLRRKPPATVVEPPLVEAEQ
jgi:hypothetical protein